jgi:S1-C subfamily serine protease
VDEAAAGSGWIGLRLAELTEPDAVVVDWVAPDSPAFVAGIAVGEVVRAVDGEVVATVTAVRAVLAGSLPGDTVVLTLWATDGSERQVSVVLGVAAPDV